jgi:hypothetical protein
VNTATPDEDQTMAYPAFATFPASTTTSFEDLLTMKAGRCFVVRGYEYRALSDAASQKKNGWETVQIRAVRRNGMMQSGWECADVMESRAYTAPLSELLTDEEK